VDRGGDDATKMTVRGNGRGAQTKKGGSFNKSIGERRKKHSPVEVVWIKARE